MRVSTVGRYALRAMVDLALQQEGEPVLRRDIVARQGISSDYLARLLGKLKQAGLIDSVMGPGGGYMLGRPAARITAGDILRAVDEVLEPVFCVDSDPELLCPRTESCATHLLWGRLGRAIVEFLDSVTLSELCAQSAVLTQDERGEANVSHTLAGDRPDAWWRGQLDDCVLIGGAGI